MIVLDTNVLSEVMRARPDARALAWMDAQPAHELWLTSVTVAEILLGIELLAAGRRKASLFVQAGELFAKDFEARVLAFDAQAAVEYATLCAMRTRAGRPIHAADAQIAAICLRHGAQLATRNARDFSGLGVALVDPWAS